MRPILCAVDDTEGGRRALSVGAWLSRGLGAELALVHVYPGPLGEIPVTGMSAEPLRRLEESARREALQLLRDLRAEVTPGLEPALHVATGDPAGRLVELGAEQDAGAIVVGSRARGRVTAAILDSVSAEVVRRARCPVVVVPPDLPAHTLGSGPIVCGVDGSEESLAAAELGAGLAGKIGARVLLVHAIEPATVIDRADHPHSAAAADRAIEALHWEGEAMLCGVAARIGLDGSAELRTGLGDPGTHLLAIAETEAAALVAVGSRGRSGLAAVLGSVSTQLARSAPCPVLLVGPQAVAGPEELASGASPWNSARPDGRGPVFTRPGTRAE